ncbi:fluoride efflux transporter FluC [Microbacterium sp. bgisy207]|jgi:CrcB protein|uniref:fluoride efflux transporter FluC n=1 Tax=Microbacterium sp. bgisy207 TaxID=3413800 RepID=UPI003EBB44B7
MTPLLFALGVLAGGGGAALRYSADVVISRWLEPPWGVLIVNVIGSFALGILTGSAAGPGLQLVIGGGLLGGFTTFSAVSVTSVLLAEEKRTRMSIMNALGTFVLALGAAAAGVALGGALPALAS